jgi:hypothetical protein
VSADADVGTPTVTGTAVVIPTGVYSTAHVGTVTLVWTIHPTGVSADVALGTVTVTGTAVVTPTGVAANVAVGTPILTIWNRVDDAGAATWIVVPKT